MTQSFEFKQSGHLDPALRDPAAATLTADKLTGRWANTNRETRGIAEITVAEDGDGYSVAVVGVGDAGPIPWPIVKAKALANLEEEAGQRTMALAADFDFGFMIAGSYITHNKSRAVI